MSTLPILTVRPGEADRIIAGHPWLYANSLFPPAKPVPDGALVQVMDTRHRDLGTGLYNSKSKIAVRMLGHDVAKLDAAFFEERIRAALEVRRRHMAGATCCRVVNAEADFLSGLIVDRYEDVLVMQTSALGMDQRKADIVAALQTVLAPRAILERSETAARKFEGLGESSGVLAGECDGNVTVKLNGLAFAANLLTGHKTGLYLDQQVNYQRVADLVAMRPGAQVLDAFTFLGGFALHAARAGAAHVLGLDRSEEALASASANAAANRLDSKCAFEAVNVFDWLKAQTVAPPHEKFIPRWDAIILDPPSFTRNRESVPNALRGYKEIHVRALKLLRPGGVLATFCCSHHVSAGVFMDTVLSAAFDQRRILRRVAVLGPSPDHPVIPMIPETEYLKGFTFEVVR
jgi:23S rRNA (cytosine1962-C5)-methyltransferase